MKFSSFTIYNVYYYLLVTWNLDHTSAKVGSPLKLTPLIRAGRVSEARRLSNVKPLMNGVVSNSGFLTVDEKYDSNLFFWFVRKTKKNWQSAPLVLYLQGGPGCSSVYGLLGENGPFYKTKNKLKRRKYAWTNHYNVLYVDQPVGTGFSYTNSSAGLLRTLQQATDHLYNALHQFFQLYSELRDNDFYVTGESYAGKYVPALAHKIHTSNQTTKAAIRMKGLFIMSGLIDPVNMMHYGEYVYQLGLIDVHQRRQIEVLEDETRAYIRAGLWSNATSNRAHIKHLISKSCQIWDYTKDELELDEHYIEYVQMEDIRQQIHVGNVSFDECSEMVYRGFWEDIMKSVKPLIEELLEHYPIAFVGGQLDVAVAYPLVVRSLKKLEWSGALEYRMARRRILYSDGVRVGGYYKLAGNLQEFFVRNAGHMIPADQPKFTLKLLNMFVKKKFHWMNSWSRSIENPRKILGTEISTRQNSGF